MAASKGQSNPAQQHNAIELLIADHERVKKLFKEFEKIKDGDDEEARVEIVESACAELKVHGMIEEEIFYPAVRSKAGEELKDILNEADVEHASVDELIDKLTEIEPSDRMYKAHFTVISAYVRHHVQQEEKEMFPRARELKELDLDELGIELRARKEDLMGDFFEDEEAQAEQSDGVAKAAVRGSTKSASSESAEKAHR